VLNTVDARYKHEEKITVRLRITGLNNNGRNLFQRRQMTLTAGCISKCQPALWLLRSTLRLKSQN
jgi:hypothetical protein